MREGYRDESRAHRNKLSGLMMSPMVETRREVAAGVCMLVVLLLAVGLINRMFPFLSDRLTI